MEGTIEGGGQATVETVVQLEEAQGIYNTGRFNSENKQLYRWPFIKVKQRPLWIFCELAILRSFNTVKTKIWQHMALLLLCLIIVLMNEAMPCQRNPLAAQKVNFLAGEESKYYLLTYRKICTRSRDWLKWVLFIQV